MKSLNATLLFLSLVFTSCIGNDFIDDRVDERISINNPINEIQINQTHQFNVTFFNNVGEPETKSLNWTSSNQNVATVNSDGFLTAISEGESTITISTVIENNMTLSEEIFITVTSDPTNQNLITKSGTIVTTSSYLLTGDFTISETKDSEDLILEISENYRASTSLPGLYLYLTNNPNSINGALELGAVQIFNGSHTYTITNTGINDYKYLLYWCKPFSVKVGEGEIND